MRSEDLVVEIIDDVLDLDDDVLDPDVRLVDIAGWDSVNALRVLVKLERVVGRAIDYEDFEKAGTVGGLAAILDTGAGGGR